MTYRILTPNFFPLLKTSWKSYVLSVTIITSVIPARLTERTVCEIIGSPAILTKHLCFRFNGKNLVDCPAASSTACIKWFLPFPCVQLRGIRWASHLPLYLLQAL